MPPDGQVMSVLKALHHIHKNFEPISYDFTCRCGYCGRCGMLVNGAPKLACWARVEAGQTYKLDPLPGFPVVKDLIVDSNRTFKKFLETKMTIKTKDPLMRPQPQPAGLWWEDMKHLNMCRECMCCYSVCPVLQEQNKWEQFVGPGAMMQIALRYLDPEDISDRLGQAVESGLFQCTQCGKCLAVCPAHIQIPKLMKQLQTDAEAKGLKPADGQTPAWPLI